MKTGKKNFRYLEGKNPEEMLFTSSHWISEMQFFSDEQKFFKNALTNFTLAVLEGHKLEEVRKLVIKISASEKEQKTLLHRLKLHKKDLEKIMENPNTTEEVNCRKEHFALLLNIRLFKKNFRKLKKDLFQILIAVLKIQNQRVLIGPNVI